MAVRTASSTKAPHLQQMLAEVSHGKGAKANLVAISSTQDAGSHYPLQLANQTQASLLAVFTVSSSALGIASSDVTHTSTAVCTAGLAAPGLLDNKQFLKC
jgi:hypothetical protein